MGISAIVYKSETGFTKEYALLLERETNLAVFPLEEKEKLAQDSEILFMGPLMGGRILGLDQAKKRWVVKGICGIGMSPPGGNLVVELEKNNPVSGAPIFYLQGGLAPKKLSWMKRQMVNMATKNVRTALESKKDRTAQEQENLDMLLHGANFVSVENLKPVLEWLEQQG